MVISSVLGNLETEIAITQKCQLPVPRSSTAASSATSSSSFGIENGTLKGSDGGTSHSWIVSIHLGIFLGFPAWPFQIFKALRRKVCILFARLDAQCRNGAHRFQVEIELDIDSVMIGDVSELILYDSIYSIFPVFSGLILHFKKTHIRYLRLFWTFLRYWTMDLTSLTGRVLIRQRHFEASDLSAYEICIPLAAWQIAFGHQTWLDGKSPLDGKV